jgi:ribonuclease BN (tRNA processing enzyme)
LAKDCDLLIHEVLFSPELEQTGAPAGRHREFIHPEWANRVRHTKPFQVGKIAAEANAGKLVLTHLWSEKEEDRLKAEVAAHYSGEIVVARDLMRV